MKTCNKCNIEKDISDFYKSKSSSDGLYSSCKDCDRLRRMEYYESNRLSIIKKKKEYVENNIEKVKDYQSIYRFKNKDRLKENLRSSGVNLRISKVDDSLVNPNLSIQHLKIFLQALTCGYLLLYFLP